MLPIHYGDQVGTLVKLTRQGPKPVGIVLVKCDPVKGHCPEWCGHGVSWGRIWCPLLIRAIRADRCKRMQKMNQKSLSEYLARAVDDLAAQRRQKRQEKQARDDEALRLAVEARKGRQGKRGPKGKADGKGVMTALGTVGLQATSPKSQQAKTAREHPPVVTGWQALPRATKGPIGRPTLEGCRGT